MDLHPGSCFPSRAGLRAASCRSRRRLPQRSCGPHRRAGRSRRSRGDRLRAAPRDATGLLRQSLGLRWTIGAGAGRCEGSVGAGEVVALLGADPNEGIAPSGRPPTGGGWWEYQRFSALTTSPAPPCSRNHSATRPGRLDPIAGLTSAEPSDHHTGTSAIRHAVRIVGTRGSPGRRDGAKARRRALAVMRPGGSCVMVSQVPAQRDAGAVCARAFSSLTPVIHATSA